jgi:hypothetical protein
MEKIVKKSWVLALMCVFAAVPAAAQTEAPSTPATAQVTATKGQMLHSADGGRLASVNKVNDDGSVQIIIDGKVVTVPANTLSAPNGELTTSLTKNQVLSLH